MINKIIAFLVLAVPVHTYALGQAFIEPPLEFSPNCQSIPSLDDVRKGTWAYSDKIYSARDAITAGIPIVNAAASQSLMLVVRDYKRYKSCLAQDGKTEIHYGQTIRAVIEINEFSAELGVNLPAIAASGTLNRKQQSFYLYKDGFYNSKIDGVISSVSGKVFDVQNYAVYQEAMNKMIALLGESDTQFSVNKLLVVKFRDDIFLKEAPIISYALYGIQKKKSCLSTQSDFKGDGFSLSIIQKIYINVTEECSDMKPTIISSETAKNLLSGISVRM